ncbi:MAG TPA: electron transport complex subunit RsxG [Mariprofundaceae bacterium]|nr:electron transport complex subunit RsxG [Mariprofundaceae bacterium]
MKMTQDQWRMAAALAVVAIVATLLLGITDLFTREPIAEARKAALHEALMEVLPQHANDALADAVMVGNGKDARTVYPARDAAGSLTGFAWETVAPDGYSGSIHILMGVHPDGSIYAIRVTDHQETPGLGDGIVKNKAWVDSFAGTTLTNTRWAVKKDGGDFDQFTGATITPRAVVKAVKRGLEFFRDNHAAILGQQPAGGATTGSAAGAAGGER